MKINVLSGKNPTLLVGLFYILFLSNISLPLQDILTLYFSHPAIEGVLFWGFWDGKLWKPEMALFEGPEVTVFLFLLKDLLVYVFF